MTTTEPTPAAAHSHSGTHPVSPRKFALCAACRENPAEVTGGPGPSAGEPLCEDCAEEVVLRDGLTTYTRGGRVETFVDCGDAGCVVLTGYACRPHWAGAGVAPAEVEQEPRGHWGRHEPPWIDEADVICAERIESALDRLLSALGAGADVERCPVCGAATGPDCEDCGAYEVAS